jgi:hypothetical protein
MDELDRLVPQLQLAAPDDQDAVAAHIEDLGDRYRVRAVEDKEIADAERRCDERARVASLLIALALETPPVVATPHIAPSPLPVGAIVPYRPRPLEWGPTKPRAQAFIDRPLVLERGRVELQASLFSHSAEFQTLDGDAILSRRNIDGGAAVSIDVGLGGRTQLGLVAAMPIRADVDAAAVIASAMVSLHRDVALRASIGWERDSPDPFTNIDTRNLLFVSLALPFRHRVHRWVSIIGGDPGLRPIWFASEPVYDNVTLPTRMTTYNDSLFAMRKGPGWFEASRRSAISSSSIAWSCSRSSSGRGSSSTRTASRTSAARSPVASRSPSRRATESISACRSTPTSSTSTPTRRCTR